MKETDRIVISKLKTPNGNLMNKYYIKESGKRDMKISINVVYFLIFTNIGKEFFRIIEREERKLYGINQKEKEKKKI
jgi:hypothetical protein